MKEFCWNPSTAYPPVRSCLFSSGFNDVMFLGDPSSPTNLPRGTLVYTTQPVPHQARRLCHCMCLCICLFMSLDYVCMCVCVCLYMYVCSHACICVYTSTIISVYEHTKFVSWGLCLYVQKQQFRDIRIWKFSIQTPIEWWKYYKCNWLLLFIYY